MHPGGRHIVRAKVGADQPVNTVFVNRRPTGEIYSEDLAGRFPGRDWILTRILWLSGCERGYNRMGEVDTMRRAIYIHGSPDNAEMGKPGSHGCIRMRNQDVVDCSIWCQSGHWLKFPNSLPSPAALYRAMPDQALSPVSCKISNGLLMWIKFCSAIIVQCAKMG